MEDIIKTTRYQFYSRVIYCVVFLVAIITLLTFIFSQVNSSYSDEDSLDYSEMWSYESGSLVDFNELKQEDHLIIHKRTNGEEINDRSLCFYSKNVFFTVYLDSEVIYDFHPDPPKLFGKAYGVFPHAISLPVLNRDGNLYIKIDSIYQGNQGYIRDMVLDNSNLFILSILQKSAYKFIFCLIVFVFGFILVTIGVIGRYFGDKRFEIISMGNFAMITSLWIAAETQMLPLLTGAPIAVHFVNYMALDLLALPGLIFVAFVIGYRKIWFIPIAAFMTVGVIAFSIISNINGYRDYHQLLWLTHILLGTVALMIIFLIIKGIVKKKIDKSLTVILIIALSISTAAGIFDIVRYAMHPDNYQLVSYFKVSLFVFILLSGIYEFISISEMSRRGKYAEIMEVLAYQDGLTNLLNRSAFNRDLEQIEKGTDKITFIMIDMNYLKDVNDKLGHATGDLYITSLARYIASSFSHDENCYRIGGDEFFIMAPYSINDAPFRDSITALQKKIELFNADHSSFLPMSIAYGCCEFNPATDKTEDKIRIADAKMYEMKTAMKAEMNL
jgi:diguanylate cyclase (GGDEF) domain